MGVLDRDYTQNKQTIVVDSSFATRVYGWMTLGLLTTALIAWALVSSGLCYALMPYVWLPVFGTLGLALVLRGALTRLSFGATAGLFLAYSGMQGLFFGISIPLFAAAVGGQVIWLAFLTAGLLFGIAMIYGLTTKSDLSRLSKIFGVALSGLIGVTLLYLIMSLFSPLPGLYLIICYIGLALFVGLTAFQAQQIRALSMQIDGNSVIARKLSIMMALSMYLNVITIFWYLLQIFSSQNRR